MPNPRKNESQKEYIARYMSSEEAKKTFPDEKQRLAVAYSKYRRKSTVKAVKKHLERK